MSTAFTVWMVVVAIGSVALFAGAMYLGGGRGAVERQAGRLAALTAITVTIVLIGPRLMELAGGAAPLLLVAVNVVVIAGLVRGRRRMARAAPPPGTGARRAMRAYWVLAAVFAAVVIGGTVLLAVLERG